MDSFISLIKENIILFDIIFLIIIIYFALQCFAKGFFLSLVSFLKMGFGINYNYNFSSKIRTLCFRLHSK